MSRKEIFNLKRALKLKDKKYRYQSGYTLIEGIKIIKDIYSIRPATVFVDSAQSNRLKAHIAHFSSMTGVDIVYISPKEMTSLSVTKTNQGMIGIYPFKPPQEAETLPKGISLLFINNQDPTNMGNIIRTAVWFGIKDLYFYQCVDPFNPKAIRSAAGSLFNIRFNAVKDIEAFLSDSSVLKIGVKEGGADLLPSHTIPENVCYIFGNEGSGIPREILDKCDSTVQIPGKGKIDSLNLQTSFAIFLYEVFRREL